MRATPHGGSFAALQQGLFVAGGGKRGFGVRRGCADNALHASPYRPCIAHWRLLHHAGQPGGLPAAGARQLSRLCRGRLRAPGGAAGRHAGQAVPEAGRCRRRRRTGLRAGAAKRNRRAGRGRGAPAARARAADQPAARQAAGRDRRAAGPARAGAGGAGAVHCRIQACGRPGGQALQLAGQHGPGPHRAVQRPGQGARHRRPTAPGAPGRARQRGQGRRAGPEGRAGAGGAGPMAGGAKDAEGAAGRRRGGRAVPARRVRAGRRAGADAVAARERQGALLPAAAAAGQRGAGAAGAAGLRRLPRPHRRQGQLHRPRGRVHRAADLQPGEPRHAGVHGGGAAGSGRRAPPAPGPAAGGAGWPRAPNRRASEQRCHRHT